MTVRLFPLVLFLGASCTHSPTVEHPDLGIEIPDQWTAGAPSDNPAVAPWWVEFGDGRLQEIIEEALRNNRDLQASAARIEAAVSRARIAGAAVLPFVDFNFDGSRTKQNFIGLPVPGGADILTSRSTSLGVSFDVTWEIDVWGRIRAGKSAALADMDAATADFVGARLSLSGQTAKVWFAILEARRQVELARTTMESFRLNSEQVRDRYERGLRPPLDLRLSLANLASAEAFLHRWEEQLDTLRRQLETILGTYPAGKIRAAEDLPRVGESIPAGLPADVVFRRPDLAAAERRLAASGARVREARAALLPRFSLTASGGTSSTELKDLVEGDFTVWRLAGNILQPLFQGGRLLAGLDLAKAESREALATYVQQAINAFAEVESALAAEKILARREEALQTALEQAAAARELAEDRYAGGLDDYISVLVAQRRAIESESQLITVQRLRLDTRVNLHLALGGGFSTVEYVDQTPQNKKLKQEQTQS